MDAASQVRINQRRTPATPTVTDLDRISRALDQSFLLRVFGQQIIDLVASRTLVLFSSCWAVVRFCPLVTIFRVRVRRPSFFATTSGLVSPTLLDEVTLAAQYLALVAYSHCWDLVLSFSVLHRSGTAGVSVGEVSTTLLPTQDRNLFSIFIIWTDTEAWSLWVQLALTSWIPHVYLSASPAISQAQENWMVRAREQRPARTTRTPRPTSLRMLVMQQVQANAAFSTCTSHVSKPETDKALASSNSQSTDTSSDSLQEKDVSDNPHKRARTVPSKSADTPQRRNLHNLQPNPGASFFGRQIMSQHQKAPNGQGKKFLPPRIDMVIEQAVQAATARGVPANCPPMNSPRPFMHGSPVHGPFMHGNPMNGPPMNGFLPRSPSMNGPPLHSFSSQAPSMPRLMDGRPMPGPFPSAMHYRAHTHAGGTLPIMGFGRQTPQGYQVVIPQAQFAHYLQQRHSLPMPPPQFHHPRAHPMHSHPIPPYLAHVY
ncbi:hypothetical protein IEO21_02220 [Rhodonia placenta]|uniref:Uncharacterized protein n=1 Tax=Rhodonia placenta TaxID=104341 RepID=A0A8H7P833_9APHY|nr:hypothetical protein IEO21_02220 [Postia placenta]